MSWTATQAASCLLPKPRVSASEKEEPPTSTSARNLVALLLLFF